MSQWATWAELHCHSSFSFLDGAATPGELVAEAARLGLEALALTDHDGMYGVPQFAQAAARLAERGTKIRTVFGAELTLDNSEPESHLLVLARDPEGYRRLCAVISKAQLAGGEKQKPVYDADALAGAHGGHWVVLTGCRKGLVPAALAVNGPDAAWRELTKLIGMFGHENVMMELNCHHDPGDDERNDVLTGLAALADVGVVATGNVHYAVPAQARLAQALAAIRARRSLDEMDGWLSAAGTAYLRSGPEMAKRLTRYPGVQERTVDLARQCAFDFSVLAPKLPDFNVPEAGHTEASWLRELVRRKAPARYGPPGAERVPGAYQQIKRELDVIEALGFPGYFLIVHDIVEFCEGRNILCQGRGSAANSAVCYAIGITSVDPVAHHLLFERFLSSGRDGPPDIDLDIEHRRREEVIQYVYGKYGRDRAAQVANVITYRPKLALRDAARALGLPPPGDPQDAPNAIKALANQMLRLPRHLGIHSGGMVICDRPVGEVCPVEWARMPGRSVLQWDKDDCAYAGLVKFDLLGLGMLAALHDCFDLVKTHYGQEWSMSTIPQEDPAVYRMLSQADTVGVFQVESRAQMATLPRLRPQHFYDLVVQVALIRPGPIQGGSVHPYLRRRDGREDVSMPHALMGPALGKTLGVPLFQEQMMQLAIDCAGFTPAEADRLRQAMSAKRAPERIAELRQRLLDGMAERGIQTDVAEDIYAKILAFSNYGFPESHAISFAYLVYASAWLKRYFPAAFTAALLRNQPMGFYAPHSLINDARRHGVEVLGVDVNASDALATLENDPPKIRLGLSTVRNLGQRAAERVAAGRPYRDLADFASRTALPADALEGLAIAGAFGCFGLTRRAALWSAGPAASLREDQLPTGLARAPALPDMTPAEETQADLWATSTYRVHPVAHLRAWLEARKVLTADAARTAPDKAEVTVAGLITHRQRPPTARGVVFLNLEDETGMLNVICPAEIWERRRRVATASSALVIRGRIERAGDAVNLVAAALYRLPVAAVLPRRDFRLLRVLGQNTCKPHQKAQRPTITPLVSEGGIVCRAQSGLARDLGEGTLKSAQAFRRVGIATAPLLVAGAMLAQTGAASAGTEHHGALYVSRDAKPGNADRSCDSATFPTIRSAVNAAHPGATIVVCHGTYHEQVVISKPLSLRGENATIDEAGVTPSLRITIPGLGQQTIFAAVVLFSSHVEFTGFKVTNAQGEGILAAGLGRPIRDLTIDRDTVVHNDLGGGVPPASTYFECAPAGQIPGDCGEGVHFTAVADSQITRSYIADNSGGVLLSDDTGPTHDNLVADDVVTGNQFDCGITVPGHNPGALNAAGKRQPSVAGVYDNVIRGNVVTDNGQKGEGAGVLFANAGPGTASYDNLVVDNYLAGNELSGVTMHAHILKPGQFEDLNGNTIIGNKIGRNNTGGDPLDAPASSKDLKTTGVLVFSGGVPVHVTIARNLIFNDYFGIWLSKPVTASGLHSNAFVHVHTAISAGH